jgi:hypothetical protein
MTRLAAELESPGLVRQWPVSHGVQLRGDLIDSIH